jgi:hypothetical protein
MPNTVLKEQPNKPALDAHIASLLLRIAKMYQIPNFDEESALLLAGDTIERFKYDPVDVLVKCLTSPPSTGEKNWRLTPDTISEWMSITLEREADNLEREHKKLKSQKVEFDMPVDIKPDTQALIQGFINSLSTQKIAPLPDGYVQEYGQRKPKKVSHSSGYVQPPKDAVVEKELKRIWMSEVFDPLTGKKNDNYLSFEEWKMI